ncbi:ankyrin [Wilcoxina mikolae CBS 423.85]|nr:ankyrin [Wilcoxina mikolae CBS 423.85]
MKLGISTTAANDIFDRNPLHWAVKSGSLETVNALITENIDVNKQNAFLNTPLHVAVLDHNLDILKSLINASADLSLTNIAKETPLFFAIRNSGFEAAHRLLEKGVDPCAENNKGQTPLRCVIEDTCNPDDEGHRREIIDLLISGGADLIAADKDGRTPLHWALMTRDAKKFKAHPSTFEYLIQRDALINAKDNEGNTVMHIAAKDGHADLVSVLLEHHAFVSIRNHDNMTPYDIAFKQGHLDIVSLLTSSRYTLY